MPGARIATRPAPAPRLSPRRGPGFPRRGEPPQPLGAGSGIGAAEHRDATAPHARDIAHRLLELIGIDVAAAADDQVLDAAGEENLAAAELGVIAGIEPFTVEQLARLVGVAVIPAGR